jgi:outer membrane protein TolC
VRLRFQKGAVSATDVLQQRKLVDSTRTEKARARRELETLRHQLAVLIGKVPGQVDLPDSTQLPELAGLPDTGMPSSLVRRRPDIRSAYLRVRSNDPRFTITGNFRTTAVEPSALLDEWLASLAGNMTAPLLDGGRREAEVDRARAAASESLHNYGQTVLTAVREVEDALSSERQQRRALEGVRRQLRLSDRTVDQLMRKYRNGTVDFLRVLDELRRHQQLQRSVLSARFRLVQDRIDLYRALGGTWNLERPARAGSRWSPEVGSVSGTRMSEKGNQES